MKLPPPIFETTTYQVHWRGRLPVEKARLDYDPDARLRLTEAEQADVDAFWLSLQGQGRRLEDLPLYRLLGAQADPAGLSFSLGLTSYREYQGTNVLKPPWALADPAAKMANPLPISMVAVTVDGYVFLQRRSGQVAEGNGLWHVTPAGNTHPPRTLRESALAELYEELAVSPDELRGEINAVGLITIKQLMKAETCLFLRLAATTEDLLRRSPDDRWEYDRLEPLKWDPATLREKLLTTSGLTPPGHAALLLGGRAEFGEEWFIDMLREIDQAS